ncbi:MAG: filamentous hemagglutinin N-terminal domain-containing protein, partial [Pseudomonadota bacterium]
LFQVQAQAQTTRPDTSLGAESSILTPAGATLNGQAADIVEGGVERGNTLFHSFSTLNVAEQQQLYFSPSDRITHIFTRVTGNTPSRIFGTLGVLGNADLLLLNPNGLLFGPESQLDINGSFFATSADEIAFGEDFRFSARSPNLPPATLLTVQPSALFFTQATPGPITAQGTLSVNTGDRIQLVGGDVNVSGNFSDSRRNAISAPEGIIELAGLTEPGTLNLSPEGLIQLPEKNDLTNLSLADISVADARISFAGTQNGDITTYANTLTLEDALIVAGIDNRSGTRQSQAGDITLTTGGNLIVTGTAITNGIRNFSLGNSGDTLITVGENLLLNDAKILTL